MMKKDWKLKRTRQCEKCPWRVDVDPYDIPRGYSKELHQKLDCTIADPGQMFGSSTAMACHESSKDNESHCVGWLVNQAGIGNNLGLRLSLFSCSNSKDIEVIGEQHQRFEDTLPDQDYRFE